MRMRRRGESIPDVSTSSLRAQMSLSQESDKHPLGTRMAWEEVPSIDARQSRPRPKDADLRRTRLAQSVDRIRAAADRRHHGLNVTPRTACASRAESSKRTLGHD
jgi:hypothetical protein